MKELLRQLNSMTFLQLYASLLGVFATRELLWKNEE